MVGMMQKHISLKEKAKTGEQIERMVQQHKTYMNKVHGVKFPRYTELWVRLEDAQPFEQKCLEYTKLVAAQAQKYAKDKKDAQKEIDAFKTQLDSYFMKYQIQVKCYHGNTQAKSIIELEKEHGELKQKLFSLKNEITQRESAMDTLCFQTLLHKLREIIQSLEEE